MKTKYIRLEMSISHTRYFNSQKDLAEYLNIKNSSKNAIITRCKKFDFDVDFNNN